MPKLYVKYVDGEPYSYRYGEEWVAMQLLVDGGYPTEEEAIQAWEREQNKLTGGFYENPISN